MLDPDSRADRSGRDWNMGPDRSTRAKLLVAALHEGDVDLAHAIDYVAMDAGVPPGESYESTQMQASLGELLRDLLEAGLIEVRRCEVDGALEPGNLSMDEILDDIERRWSEGDP